jgi:hypothetical protein
MSRTVLQWKCPCSILHKKHNYHNSEHYPSFFLMLKHNVSTLDYFHLHVGSIQLGPIELVPIAVPAYLAPPGDRKIQLLESHVLNKRQDDG